MDRGRERLLFSEVVHVPVALGHLYEPYWNLEHSWVREFVRDADEEIALSPSLSGGFVEDAVDETIVRWP